MKIKQSAYLVGKLGGRPRKPSPERKSFRGGYSIITFYLLQQDGISRIILEDGSGFLELEFHG